jgi:two-component system, OmpR family, alkaline phosphatase synthesis response regulator PhoP
MKKRILVVEDEAHIADGIRVNLELEGYEVAIAADGPAALTRHRDFDLIVLDVMLPGLDGLSVCKQIREKGNRVPILFLTARDTDSDRIAGLEAGGDDYLTKPFNLKELLLRIRGMLRRQDWYDSERTVSDVLSFGDSEVNFKTYRGKGPAGPVELTQKEIMLLRLLAEHEGEVITRDRILDQVWGYDVYPTTRTVDNFILRLRKYFEPDPALPVHFHTYRGAGYKFTRYPTAGE